MPETVSEPGPEERGWFKRRLHGVQAFRQRHETAETSVVFVAGFGFDVVTLSRADDLLTVLQQGAYLLALCALLALEQRQALRGDLPGFMAKALQYAEAGIHFLLGALLSAFTLNYFKSGSGIGPLVFVAVVFVLLVANELPQFRRYGPVVRYALLSFCLVSYFATLLPVLVGKVRPWMFLVASAVTLAAVGGLFWLYTRWGPERRSLLARSVLPALGVQVALVSLYFLKVIPPVPLALTYIGVYHYVEPRLESVRVQATGPGSTAKSGKPATREERFVTTGSFRLLHERPWWRFWQHGDQVFYARDGDQVWVFLSIFAPNKFRDQIFVVWERWNDDRGEWMPRDKHVVQLGLGGDIREAGWRIRRNKTNYEPGEWRAEAQTQDGRTIGSIRFTVLKDTRTEPRQFRMDLR